jgi:hypothetical protein
MQEHVSYVRAALKEPFNIGGLLLAGAAAAFAAITGPLEPVLILGATAIAEGVYLLTLPNSAAYRRRIDRRSHRIGDGQRRQQRLEMIKGFDPREREAVEYLSWMKGQIAGNYQKVAGPSAHSRSLQELETAWESYVDLLDEYRRRKTHLRSINRQTIENQLRQAERNVLISDEATRGLHEKNVEILQRRLLTCSDIERSVKRIEAQLQMIENFFYLINDQVVTMPMPENHLSTEFDSLLTSIEATREILQQTAPVVGQLDQLTREVASQRPTFANK